MLLELIFIFLGISGILIRRNLFAIAFCFLLVFLGIMTWLVNLGDLQTAFILGFIFSLLMLTYSTMVVFVWRERGTLHIDEIQELRG